jgi:hypothetical protein
MIVTLVFVSVLSSASIFDSDWCNMEQNFLSNISKKKILENGDLDFCKKFASVLISELKFAVPECYRLIDEECCKEKSFDACDSNNCQLPSEKLSGLIGRLSEALSTVNRKLPDEYRSIISSIHDSNEETFPEVCDKAISALSK